MIVNAIAEIDHGSAVSLACAKGLAVLAQRNGGQPQFSPLLLAPGEAITTVAKVQTHFMEHLS